MVIGKVLAKTANVFKKVKMGKQIGKTAQDGLQCYKKTNKDLTKYTLWDSKANKVKGTKTVCDRGEVKYIHSYDAEGNLLSSSEKIASSDIFHTKPKFTNYENIRTEYDKFGRTIHNSRTTFNTNNKNEVLVKRNIDENISETTINTLTGKRTNLNLGKKIGKTAKDGTECYVQTRDNYKIYTTLDTKTGKIKEQKFVTKDKDFVNRSTYDAENNLISESRTSYNRLTGNEDFQSSNKFAREIINNRIMFNKFGQKTYESEIKFKPNTKQQNYTTSGTINDKIVFKSKKING